MTDSVVAEAFEKRRLNAMAALLSKDTLQILEMLEGTEYMLSFTVLMWILEDYFRRHAFANLISEDLITIEAEKVQWTPFAKELLEEIGHD